MEIKNMRKIDKGNLKAFFTLDTPTLEINDCKLMVGRDGQLYAAMPQSEYQSQGQRKWKNVVYIKNRDLLDKISNLAREEYSKINEPNFNDNTPPDNDIPF